MLMRKISGNNFLNRTSKLIKKHYWDYLFIGPDVIVFSIFIAIPLVMSIVLAFKDFSIMDGIFASPFIGVENFKYVLADEVFWIALKNTAIYTIILKLRT